jgi:hypothetical protein
MTNRRGANAAPELSDTPHPASEVVRLHDRAPAARDAARPENEARPAVIVDDDDLYGNLPFTD